MTDDAQVLINELRTTLGKMEMAFNTIAEAIVWTDAKGRIEWCNASFDRLIGREHLEVIAVNFKEPRRDFNAVIRANKDLKVTYVHDERGVVSDRYGVTALPNMFIIGQDGVIAQTHRGYSEDVLESFTEELLQLLPEEALQRKVAAP